MIRLCTICARGNSKGVQDKNIRFLCGMPLIAHSIQQAKLAGIFKYVAVSSDSSKILDIAKEWGADILIARPDNLAGDDAPKLPAIRHCVSQVEEKVRYTFDTIVDLDATSPLRNQIDIIKAVELLELNKADNVITGCRSRRSPYFNMVSLDEMGHPAVLMGSATPVYCRQRAPLTFDLNASIYVWQRSSLFRNHSIFTPNTRFYEMPPERSHDIDDMLDFEIVKLLLGKALTQPELK